MIDIKTLATGSSGNAYHISDGQTELLLECGIKFKDIQKATGFKTRHIKGCLLTHEHKDHSGGLKDVIRNGIDVYMSKGTAEAENVLNHHRVKVIEKFKDFRIGSWLIKPFDIEHDAAEPLGFFLQSDNGNRLLFITDSYYVKYRFPKLTHIMIECNYDLELLEHNIEIGRTPAFLRNRLLKSHFSLENVKDFLKANDLSSVEEIHLLHLSDSNSDEERFKREIQELTGKIVYVA